MSEAFKKRPAIPRAISPPPRIIANGPSTHAGGEPLVSGSTGVADAVVVGEAVGLALGEADALALGEAVELAEAEALEAGLAAALSSTPRLFIPLSSKLLSSALRTCIPLS